MTLSHSRWDEKARALGEFARQGKASTARPGPEEISVRKFTAGESLSASNKRPAPAGLLLDYDTGGIRRVFLQPKLLEAAKTQAGKVEPTKNGKEIFGFASPLQTTK